ncbi:MAG: N-acetylmuramoyl-L-alanine amidase [Gammaproteobacteria bacterium]|nr:N-acetylmuramoyl-L-alanine amidase [Gammaproteobacteria bacterium]
MTIKNNFSRAKKGLLLILSLLPIVSYASEPRLTQLQVMKLPTYSRLIFTLSEPVKYHVFMLHNPHRLVVDLYGAKSKINFQSVTRSDTAIQSIRTGHPKDKIFRIVFDLNRNAHYKKFMAEDTASHELVVDFSPVGEQAAPAPVSAPTPAPVPVAEKVSDAQPVTKPKRFLNIEIAQPRQKTISKITSKPVMAETTQKPSMQLPLESKRKIIIVIDAGHGGKDPGTVGARGTKEKDVVLRIAQSLKQLIDDEPNMRAVLTRHGDYFVTLRDRLRLARKDKGDVFIAIHADSYFNNQSTGASVYALSRHGATTEAARWLAKRENYSELGGVNFSGLGDKSYVLRSVLIDLAQTATITDSVRLGGNVLTSLKNVTNLHYARVEQAPFMVLKSPDIPSILVETGFLSNPVDEENLRDVEHRDQLAQALLEGIKRYVAAHPNMTL